MSLRVNQNVNAIKTHGVLSFTSGQLAKSIERLSSGLRINRAADDAAGLTISEKLRRSVRGLARAILNAQDGISMIQTAEGALNETHSILQRMRELAVQAGNDTLTSNDRLEIQKEVNQLRDDLNRISRNTEFNTKKLLDGSQTALISTSSPAIQGLVTDLGQDIGDFDLSIALVQGGISQMHRTQILSKVGPAGGLADGFTQLRSIAQFHDANGVFVLETPQILTISGSGKSEDLVLDAQMSLDQLAANLQNALTSVKNLNMENSLARVITTVASGIAGLGGYIEVVSGTVGEEGRISFAGDQKLIDSLGLTITRAAKNNRVNIQATDVDGNTRQIETDTDRGSGLLDGIDILFTSQPAQLAGTQGLSEGLYLSASESFRVGAGTTATTIVLVSGYWTMEGLTRSINMQVSTAVASVGGFIPGFAATIVDGELRLTYDRPATLAASIPSTIIMTEATNATTLGFLNGFYSGFVQARKNPDKIAWGFTRYREDIAISNTVSLLISDGVVSVTVDVFQTLGSAGNSIADMVSFEAFKATVNEQLLAGTVKVRVDQSGNAMAFTSLRVGKENLTNSDPYTSLVTVEISTASGGTVSAGQSFFDAMGMDRGTRRGTGDTNFRVHIAERTPQFHIGSDQGQTMQISIRNLSARALDVENLDMTSISGAESALGKISKAIDRVSAERSKLGAYQNRLEYAINSLRQTHSNTTAAESRLRDADMAQEMILFSRHQILQQSGTAMLAQANVQAEGILQLLR